MKRLFFILSVALVVATARLPSSANVRSITVRNTTPYCAVVTAYSVHSGTRAELFSISVESNRSGMLPVGGIQRALIHAKMKTGTCSGSYYSGLSAGYETETADDRVKIIEVSHLFHIVKDSGPRGSE